MCLICSVGKKTYLMGRNIWVAHESSVHEVNEESFYIINEAAVFHSDSQCESVEHLSSSQTEHCKLDDQFCVSICISHACQWLELLTVGGDLFDWGQLCVLKSCLHCTLHTVVAIWQHCCLSIDLDFCILKYLRIQHVHLA